MHKVALRPSERRSLDVVLFRLNEFESYYKLNNYVTHRPIGQLS